MRGFTLLATLLAAVTSVAAHGHSIHAVSDGNTELAWDPNTDPYDVPNPIRAFRKIPNDGPVSDASNFSIACNVGGEDGTEKVFDVKAGSDITIQWTNWPADHLGPVTTLMASCNGNCSTFKASDGRWFKIDESGYSDGKWGSTRLINNGNKWTSNIPAGLASGQYLVRYEIVALHSTGHPQYYPGCLQVNVKGGGTDKPSPNELTSLPGMYDGFKWPDIWADPLDGFVVAGPKVVSFASGNSSDPSPAPSPSSVSSSSVPSHSHGSSTATNPQPTSTPVNPSVTAVCKSKKRSKKRTLPARHVHRRNTRH